MKIGLVRHFKVNLPTKSFMTSYDFEEWVKQYDMSDIIENKVNLRGLNWDKCFSSDLPRAVKTSQAIFKGTITETSLLREVPISPIFKSGVKLPYIFWLVASRLAWLFNHSSQSETKEMTHKRIHKFLDLLETEEDSNTLVVCHGFFMHTLQKELKLRGFKGETIASPRNGSLYLYQK